MPEINQNTYVLIPGKNWKLSLAEVIAFLEAKGAKYEVSQISKEFFNLIIKGENGLIADAFGGILKIGEITGYYPTSLIEKAFLENNEQLKEQIRKEVAANKATLNILETSRENIFGISVYCAADHLRPVSTQIQKFLGNSVKQTLALHGRKTRFMGIPPVRSQPQLTVVEVLKKEFVKNRAEILFCIGKRQTIIATTIAVHNPFEFQKRDVGKPVQRKIFAIPPRLARIMVNLSLCNMGKVLVDPFCGVGTILQEALLSGAKVVGVDKNPWCIKAATANLQWLQNEYNLKEANYEVICGDACELDKLVEKADCIVTEPDLGPALRQIPTVAYAKRVIAKLEPLFFAFLEAAYATLKTEGRLVLVTPYLQTRSGKAVTMPISEKAKDIGFKRVYPFQEKIFAADVVIKDKMAKTASFVDAERRHKVGREIHIFKK
ncbi:MAG: DNA methyltransferase [Candidatus Bathyarchaeia archaeon]